MFKTAWAQLRLYDLLDTLQGKVCYVDTDSVIYAHGGSGADKTIEGKIGPLLGQPMN